THIKASANKKKYQKEQVSKAAKVYTEQLRQEVNAEREKLGKKPINDDDDHDDEGTSGGGMVEKTVSTTDPDAGMLIKGNMNGSLHTKHTQLATSEVLFLE